MRPGSLNFGSGVDEQFICRVVTIFMVLKFQANPGPGSMDVLLDENRDSPLET
jgi:hypothetical protein